MGEGRGTQQLAIKLFYEHKRKRAKRDEAGHGLVRVHCAGEAWGVGEKEFVTLTALLESAMSLTTRVNTAN